MLVSVLLSVLFVIPAVCVVADEIPVYTPAATKVAVMPVVSITGEKWDKVRNSQIDCSYNELESQFRERGFELVSPDEVMSAIRALSIDLKDEEEWKRDTFYKIGEKLGTDLIVFVLITDSTQRVKTTFFTAQNEGHAKIKIWLLDAKNHINIKSSKQYDAKRVQGSFGRGAKGSALQVDAARRAIETALADFLKPYKIVKEVKRAERRSPRVGDESGVEYGVISGESSDEDDSASDADNKNSGMAKPSGKPSENLEKDE